ncbi:MAG: glycosyltransferase [Acidobacteria bacterium]|nr:glycosyltransferase [Acidobacteriota bacterium]
MKIGVVVAHPTQFEGPFFRYAARDAAHDIRIIYTDLSRKDNIYDPEISANVSWGIDLLSGYQHSWMPSSGRMRWLRRDIKHEKYDLLIVNGYSRSEYLLAALYARFLGTPTALRLDSVLFDRASRTKQFLKKIMFRGFTHLYQHFFATSTLTIEYLQRYGIKRDRISLFSYAVDNDYFKEKSSLTPETKASLRTRYNLPGEDRIILSVTKFNEREAPWDLLKAFCDMPRPRPVLLLVGDGDQRSLLEQHALNHGADDVIFAGYVPYPELPGLYGIATIFVHPTHYEPWGVSVQEALACGLPVIASSRVGAGYDLIEPDKNGAIYDVGNPQDLANKLIRLLESDRPDLVVQENDRILSKWNYDSSWRNVIEATRLVGTPQ